MGEDLSKEATRLANEMNKVLSGAPTVSVYLAISMILGEMERRAQRPNRPAMLSLIDESMSDYLRQVAN
jgi:hypothetical protein